jgi:chemotaxis protein methyltransferase CheR
MLYRRINLSKPPYPMRGELDMIFCRNVMIYFDNRVRQGFLDEAYRLLKPGGHLFIGHTESLAGVRHKMKTVSPSVFQKG